MLCTNGSMGSGLQPYSQTHMETPDFEYSSIVSVYMYMMSRVLCAMRHCFMHSAAVKRH